jgi:hypothetical protein
MENQKKKTISGTILGIAKHELNYVNFWELTLCFDRKFIKYMATK